MAHSRWPSLRPGLEFLEVTSAKEIKDIGRRQAALKKLHWDLHSALEYQRGAIEDDLFAALNNAATRNFKFEQWQRAVRWRYSQYPLSTVGSVRDEVGGRFNIGNIDPARFPPFPALYLSKDKDTALQEALGQEPTTSGLTPQEVALLNPQSETIVSVSGTLERVIDLFAAARLGPFVDLIAEFSVPRALRERARLLGERFTIVSTVEALLEALGAPYWRRYAMLLDLPAPCQIFGRLVRQAGIEGIVYPSKLTKTQCLAVFPGVLQGTASYVECDDPPPTSRVATRLDSSTWKASEQSPPAK